MAQRHMDRLTSFDTSFLANEKSNGHMAIGAVLVCEGEPPSHEEFLASIRSRLHLLPRLRQRLSYPPLGLGRPFWVDHTEFDVHQHVSRRRLPAPGSEEQFRVAVAETFAPPLDRSRPLWELCLVEGIEGDRFAIVYKTHHAMADGISAVDIGVLLFDVEPTTEAVPEPAPWEPKPAPSRLRLVGQAVRGFGNTFVRAARWLAGAFRHPRWASKRASDGIAGLWEVTWNLTKPAPKVPLNVDISPHRCFRGVRCDLEEFKAIKNALGGTVNDVSLAVTAGALRNWMLDRGLETDGIELQALVPVSIRTEDQHGELGNKLTAMRGPLPVGVADPGERLRFVSAAMDDLKASKQPLGAEAIWGLNDWFRDFAPPLLLGPTAAINFSTRLFNLLVTNFPGPQIPFYVRGRELVEVYPIGFLARHHALAIAIISYNGAIGFGLLGDRESMDDLNRLGDYIETAVEELRVAAGIASPGDGDELAGDPRPRAAGTGTALG
jgi:diacylglycerol O-acyltransferase / wax synthase